MTATMSSSSPKFFVTPCDHLTVFTASGADANSFLQSQLTQDVSIVSPSQSALAGFCTAQGRLWASMLLAQRQAEGEILGVLSTDLAESFLKRLRMFVLRSKVTLGISTDLVVHGVRACTTDMAALSQQAGGNLPASVWSSACLRSGLWIRIPSATEDSVRFLLLAKSEQIQSVLDNLGDRAHLLQDRELWRAQDIQAGLAWIEAATQDMFIAQTLNLDLVGAVSFTKGCYPGQEVVARAHYRGTIKRRMHLARIDRVTPDVKAGSDVFDPNEPDNPVGRLIQVAVGSDGNTPTWVLFEAPFNCLEGDPLRAASASGPPMVMQPLPYEVATPSA